MSLGPLPRLTGRCAAAETVEVDAAVWRAEQRKHSANQARPSSPSRPRASDLALQGSGRR